MEDKVGCAGMELITTHTHSTFCGHAKDGLEDMVAAAAAAGITTYAATEHFPLSASYDPTGRIGMPAARMDEYFEQLQMLRNRYPQMDIIIGCELDWLGDDEDRDLDAFDFQRFELVLGSVHYVDRWAFDDPDVRDRWDKTGPDEIWRRYADLWCDAVSSDAPFSVMSHPDLVKKFNYYPSFDLKPLYGRMVEAASGSGRMIELNTSGDYYACGEVFPAPELLAEFHHAGVPCTVGTDAHDKADVARGIRKAYRSMYEAGYRVVTVPTRDGDRREVPIQL